MGHEDPSIKEPSHLHFLETLKNNVKMVYSVASRINQKVGNLLLILYADSPSFLPSYTIYLHKLVFFIFLTVIDSNVMEYNSMTR